MSEYTKNKVIDDLTIIKRRIDSLYKICTNREVMDDETIIHIEYLYNHIIPICSKELSKELSKQKSEGKKFISDEEVNKLVNKVLKEK